MRFYFRGLTLRRSCILQPYLASYDSPPAHDGPVRQPDWSQPGTFLRRRVTLLPEAIERLASLPRRGESRSELRLFKGDAKAATRALRQMLAVDVSRPPRAQPYIFLFDGVAVEYTVGVNQPEIIHEHDECNGSDTADEGDARTNTVVTHVWDSPQNWRVGSLAAGSDDVPPVEDMSESLYGRVPQYRACDLSAAEFRLQFSTTNKPVLISNCASDSPAWTLEALQEFFHDRSVIVRKHTQADDYRLGRTQAVERMKFGRYCTLLLACKNNPDHCDYFLAAQNLRHVFPELVKEPSFQVPDYVSANGRVHSGPFLWIACGGHREFTHFDPGENAATRTVCQSPNSL